MAKYIDREAVLKHKRKMSGTDWGGEFWDEAVLCEDIRKIPAADVVEVVRCRDCKYYEIHQPIHKKICEKNDGYLIPMLPDNFCSYGERKGGEGDGDDKP